MTREKKPAAPSAAHRAASLLTGALMIAGLAGCGNNLFPNSEAANASLKAKPAVAVSPVLGVPQKYTSKVTDQLIASMKEKGVQVVDANDAQYILKAAYIAMPEPKKGTKVTYSIDVTDKAGNRVRRIEGEELVSPKRGGDAWTHVTDEAVQKVAIKSATDINAWIENPSAPANPVAVAEATDASQSAKPAHPAQKVASAKSASQTSSLSAAVVSPLSHQAAAKAPHKSEVIALVPNVTGAPGDGQTALADAMKRALNQRGVKLTDASAAGVYKIQGHVEMGAAADGQQPITIRWLVVDPSGKQMEKTVVQNNKVEAGRLDKNWGDIADQAAGAAAVEVMKLLNKSSTTQASNGSAG